MRGRHVSPEASAQRRQLYDQGLSDRAIGRAVGVCFTSIAKWRRNNGLAPQHAGGPIRGTARDARQQLYDDGLNDAQIAEVQGVSHNAVGLWRRLRGLARNPVRPRKRRAPRRAFVPMSPRQHPLYALIADTIGRGVAPDVADDAISDTWLALIEGRVELADVRAEAQRCRAAAIGQWASGHGPRSLDADLGDGFTLMAVVRDTAMTPWLERMGATVC